MFMSELAIQTGANAQSVVSWILSETSLCLKDLRKNFQENFGGEVFSCFRIFYILKSSKGTARACRTFMQK